MLVTSFEKMLNTKLLVPENPQLVGAIGAASLALRRYRKKQGG